MNEIWKDIKGFEGIYQVSNLGNVKSLEKKVRGGNNIRTFKEVLRALTISTTGYYTIVLQSKPKSKRCKVHRLVMLAFVGDSKLDVNHKDGNKLNNNLNNLEYCTRSENIRHAYRTGLIKCKPVICNENKKVYKTMSSAARDLNVYVANVHKVLNGVYKQTGGYTFNYYKKNIKEEQ